MPEISGLFNDSPGQEREYDDTYLSRLFSLFTKQAGIEKDYENELEVSAGSGLQVDIETGAAWVGAPSGWWYYNDAVISKNIDAETAGSERIDIVVLKLDRNTDTLSITSQIVKGTPASSNPSKPNLTQNATVYELPLADAYVTGGSTDLTVVNYGNYSNSYGRVVAEEKLAIASEYVEFTDLDIKSDGVYKLIIYGNSTSVSTVYKLSINGVTTNYKHNARYHIGSSIAPSSSLSDFMGYAWTTAFAAEHLISLANGYPVCLGKGVALQGSATMGSIEYDTFLLTAQANIDSIRVTMGGGDTFDANTVFRLLKEE